MTLSQSVAQIIEDVRRRGDAALCGYARRFDRVTLRPAQLRVSPAELRAAREKVTPNFLKALRECAGQVRRFAEDEKRRLAKSWMVSRGSSQVGQLIRPVDSVGQYIPGG